MEELLKRFPEWEMDYDNAVLSSTSTVRGWDSLPVWVGKKPANAKAPVKPVAAAPEASAPVPLEGKWNVVVKGPTGPQPAVLTLQKMGTASPASRPAPARTRNTTTSFTTGRTPTVATRSQHHKRLEEMSRAEAKSEKRRVGERGETTG